jgi:hypothetical protein
MRGKETPRRSGASQGYREERYVCVLCEGYRHHQAPLGTLNRVDAVSAARAAPMPTKKIPAFRMAKAEDER